MVQQSAEVSLFKLLLEDLSQGEKLSLLLAELREQGLTLDDLLTLRQLAIEGIDPERYIFEHLEDDAASHDMAVDASAGIGYRYACPAGQVVSIHRLTFWGVDNSKPLPNGFFTIAALGVGDGSTVKIHDADDSVIIDLTMGEEVRHHLHFAMLAGIDVQTASDGGAQGGWAGRWSLSLAGAPAQLTAGQYIEVTNNADLSSFTEYEWMVQGIRVSPL